MATYAPTSYSGTTGVFEYTIGFVYAQSSDVKVYVDGVLDTDWYFTTNGTKIKWDTPDEPQTGETFIIKRVTDISDLLTTFTDGSGLTAADLNSALKQAIYSIDELQYPAYTSTTKTPTQLFSAELNEPHGLGAAPFRWQVICINVSTDLGYTAGDTIDINCSATPVPITFSATHCNIADGGFWATFTLPHKTTGTQTTVSGTKWVISVRAWR